MQALNNSSFWTNQVEINESQKFTLFYVTPEVKNTSKANETVKLANMPEMQGTGINNANINMCQPQGLEISLILNEHLNIDTTNISSLLYRIILFVRNKFLNGKTEKNIFHIAGFGYTACNLISSIYELG